MRSRFASNLFVLLAGAFLAPVRFAFEAPAVKWLVFGLGAACLIVVALAFLVRGRGSAQRLLDLLIVATGAWTVVSSLTYAPATVGWLALGEGGTLAILAAIGLCLHEARMERAVGQLAVVPDGDRGSSNGKVDSVPSAAVSEPSEPAPAGLAPWPS